MINHLRGGDILDGDADGFIERDFTRAAASCLGAGEDFADLAMDIDLRRWTVSLSASKNIATLGHDRFARVDHDFGAFHRRAIDFTQVRTMRAHGVDVNAGLEPFDLGRSVPWRWLPSREIGYHEPRPRADRRPRLRYSAGFSRSVLMADGALARGAVELDTLNFRTRVSA